MKKSKFLSLILTFAMVASMVVVPSFAAEGAAAAAPAEGHWSDVAMGRWASVGVFKGDQYGDFMPAKEMTRAEFAQVLVNLMGYTEKAENTFADIPAGEWYADAMLKLVAAGVIQGTGYNEVGPIASPTAPISREQAAVLLCRALSLKPTSDAKTDTAGVSEWAKDAMAALTERGMMTGDQYGNLMPAVTIDRGSVAQLVNNMVSEYVTQNGAVVSGEQKGIVIVAADNVTFTDAKLGEAVVVAPKAARATVTLAGTTAATNVVVAAEGANLVVTKSASVNAITLTASRAKTTVSGTVGTIVVAETAANATVTTKPGAQVDTVTVASAGAVVDGAKGTINAVVAEPTATGVKVNATGAELINKSAEKVGGVAPGASGKAPGSVNSASAGGGSSSSSADVYSIVKDSDIKHGVISVTSSAVKGETVTIAATPDAGYELAYFEVTTIADGKLIHVTMDGKFTMPGEDVRVSALFQKIEEGAYKINKDTKIVNGAVVVTASAKMGDTVAVVADADDGYEVKSITVTYASGKVVDITIDKKFKMPGEDVTVSATFAVKAEPKPDPKPTQYNITTKAVYAVENDTEVYKIASDIEVKVYIVDGPDFNGKIEKLPGEPVTKAAAGEYLYIDYTKNEKYEFVVMKMNVEAVTSPVAMPAEDVEIVCYFKLKGQG